MAKKIGSKLSLKRETLRQLSDDQLQAVGGGTDLIAYGGVIGTITSVGPTKTDPYVGINLYYYKSY
ncbi:MAG TPA: class I lanthipeptide [Kofleriaceae bacterium]|nr:class I lanthipeptide [Kofleriaceae bacterium]